MKSDSGIPLNNLDIFNIGKNPVINDNAAETFSPFSNSRNPTATPNPNSSTISTVKTHAAPPVRTPANAVASAAAI